MRYLLLMHHEERGPEQLTPEAMDAAQRAMSAYAGTLEQAGVLLSADILQPSVSSTTIAVAPDGLRVQDGPFAETKEQLAGVFVLDVPDLDAAISWARRAPQAEWGTVEIRPGAVHTEDGQWMPNH